MYGVLSRSQICRNLHVFGAIFCGNLYASVLFKSLFATLIQYSSLDSFSRYLEMCLSEKQENNAEFQSE